MELSIVIPCLNESRTIGACVRAAKEGLRAAGCDGEVVVVDNGSSDGSDRIATSEGARVVNERRKGYGQALLTGFREARGRYILMGDGDGSYDFTTAPMFLRELRGGAEFVVGNRFRGGIDAGAMPWMNRWLGNPVLSGLLNLIFKTGIGDVHCGLRAFSREAFETLGLRTPGMEFASEMVIRAAACHLTLREIPIRLHRDGRGGPSHLHPVRDGLRHLRLMFLFAPQYLFILPGVLMMAAGLLGSILPFFLGGGRPEAHFGPHFIYSSLVVGLLGMQLVAFGVSINAAITRTSRRLHSPAVENLAAQLRGTRFLAVSVFAAILGLSGIVFTLFRFWELDDVQRPVVWVGSIYALSFGLSGFFTSLMIFAGWLLGEQVPTAGADARTATTDRAA